MIAFILLILKSLIMMFGYYFFVRCLDYYRQKIFYFSFSMTKIGTFYLLWCLISELFPVANNIFRLIYYLLPPILLLAFKKYVQNFYKIKFEKEFLSFLSHTLLFLKNGKAFRDAFKSSIYNHSPFFQEKAKKLYDVVVFSQQKYEFVEDLALNKKIKTLKTADENQYLAQKCLRLLHSELLMIEKFRHRSNKISTQLRIQSGILTLIYVTLVIYLHLNQIPVFKSDVFYFSFFLFVLGFIVTTNLWRTFKWKV